MDITRYDDRSLKPVPRQSPIPRNTVACVERRGSGDPDAPTLFILSKNGTDLVISGPPLPKIPGVELLTDYEATVVLGNALLEYLEVLENLAPTIEFGITNWAHLVRDPATGDYQIILDYAKKLKRVSCPTWAPIIPLEEVEFTVWAPLSDRRGMWRGKPVDIFYAHNDQTMWLLNRAMYGFRRIDGLDFTFELYGHLVDRDGQVVGLVTEAAWGRPIGLSDRDFVTSELKRLESHGYLYGATFCNSFLIADGKLRFLQPIGIRKYSNPEELKREAAFIHTKAIDELFQEFEDFGPFGNFRLLPMALTGETQEISTLYQSIPRGIWVSNILMFNCHLTAPGFTTNFKFGDVDPDGEESSKRLVSLRGPRGEQRKILQMRYKTSQDNALSRDDDRPLSSRTRLRHRIFLPSTHPYARLSPEKNVVCTSKIIEVTEY